MRILKAALAAAIAMGTTSAALATDTSIGFTSGATIIFGSRTAAGTNQTDTFTFSSGTADFFSGSITTRQLVDTNTGTVFSNLNFLGATLVDVTTGTTLQTYAAPGAAADETINIPSIALNDGDIYTLSINYDVIVASDANAASYGGPLFLAATSDVPEAATWAMMIGGFGIVGAGMRRRRATVAFA